MVLIKRQRMTEEPQMTKGATANGLEQMMHTFGIRFLLEHVHLVDTAQAGSESMWPLLFSS